MPMRMTGKEGWLAFILKVMEPRLLGLVVVDDLLVVFVVACSCSLGRLEEVDDDGGDDKDLAGGDVVSTVSLRQVDDGFLKPDAVDVAVWEEEGALFMVGAPLPLPPVVSTSAVVSTVSLRQMDDLRQMDGCFL